MRPPEAELKALVGEWVKKAAQDFAGAERLAAEGSEFKELVVFHAQQAVEKYLKALLVLHQVEFPKTHDIEKLLRLLDTSTPSGSRLSASKYGILATSRKRCPVMRTELSSLPGASEARQ